MIRHWVGLNGVRRFHCLQTVQGAAEANFLFNDDGSEVQIEWQSPNPDAEMVFKDLSTWVGEAALGFAIRLRGWPILHASAAVVDGQAVALLGPKQAGKSTLAAALLTAGYPLLADDHVVLKPAGAAILVHPGPARMRLWTNSLPVLNAQAEQLERVYTQSEKRLVQLSNTSAEQPQRYYEQPIPLGALYILQPRQPERQQPASAALTPAAALHQLLIHRWGETPISQEHTQAEVKILAQLAKSAPVRRLYRPDSLETLPQVIELIRSDLGPT